MSRAVFESKRLVRPEGACVFLRSRVVANQGSGRGFRGRLRSALSTGNGVSPKAIRGRGLRGACAEAVGGRPDSPLFGFAILRGSGSGGGSGGWSL